MFWLVVTYGLIPVGLLLCALQLINHPTLLGIGSAVSKLEIKFSFGKYGTVRLPLSLFIAAFAVISLIAQFSQVQHYSSLVSNVDTFNTPTQVNDRYRSMNFRAERNFWISFAWLATWLFCWRLSDLKGKHALTAYTPPPSDVPGSNFGGIISIIVVVLLLACADLPVARLNYNFMVSQNISPDKARLATMATDCEAAYFATAEGQCREFCQQVRFLADERLRIVGWVRSWHMTGTWAAQIFDGVRGVDQSQDRISELFATKPCMQVLNSVDKTNTMVNAGCWISAGVCVFLGMALLFGRLDGNAVPAPPAPQETKKDK